MTKFMTRNEEIILLAILKLKDDAYGVSIRKQILLQSHSGRPSEFAEVKKSS